MSKDKEILALSREGHSGRWIAKYLNISRNTVAKTLAAEQQHSVSDAELAALCETDLHRHLFPEKQAKANYGVPHLEYIHKELKRPGVTLAILWEEYKAGCSASGQTPYQYSRFCDLYRDYVRDKGLTMVLTHKPGDETMVDWAGTTMQLTNPETGAVSPVYIFVGVLPFSMYTFALACPDMKEASWIDAHAQMFAFFGGVTRLLVCDNPKTAVIHHRKHEPPVLNRTYQEMADHYRIAVLPARVYRPRDKAAGEAAVRLVTEHIIAPLRNTTFFELDEMNNAIAELRDQVNGRPFQKRSGSRESVFRGEEAESLRPLPDAPFSMPTWNTATVQKNYHVAVGKEYYSVPYQFKGKKVDIRSDSETVTIYFEGAVIAAHRKDSTQRYHTLPEHMPLGHRIYQEWNAPRFLSWASSKGQSVREVVRQILAAAGVEEQAYKTLFALLQLPKKYPKANLEAVCAEILDVGGRVSLRRVTDLMKKAHEAAVQTETSAAPAYAMMRGRDYYAQETRKEGEDK